MIDVVIFTPTTFAKDATFQKPMGINAETGKLSQDGYFATQVSAFDLADKFEGLVYRTITREQWVEIENADLKKVGGIIAGLLKQNCVVMSHVLNSKQWNSDPHSGSLATPILRKYG